MDRFFKNSRTQLVLLLLLSTTCTSYAQTHWTVSKSSVTFSIKNAGITVTGTFDSLVADINFDTVNYAKGTINATVGVNTINTDNNLRNKHLKKEEYFDADKYPMITMKSLMFKKQNDGKYIGYFNLTIKNVTKEVGMLFTYTQTNSSATFNGTLTLDRRDYTVGGNSLIMSDTVTINIVVEGTK
jgi:polyisoprenoid-binding protein YceI